MSEAPGRYERETDLKRRSRCPKPDDQPAVLLELGDAKDSGVRLADEPITRPDPSRTCVHLRTPGHVVVPTRQVLRIRDKGEHLRDGALDDLRLDKMHLDASIEPYANGRRIIAPCLRLRERDR